MVFQNMHAQKLEHFKHKTVTYASIRACVRASDTMTVTSSATPADAPYARHTAHRTWPSSRSSAGNASAAAETRSDSGGVNMGAAASDFGADGSAAFDRLCSAHPLCARHGAFAGEADDVHAVCGAEKMGFLPHSRLGTGRIETSADSEAEAGRCGCERCKG